MSMPITADRFQRLKTIFADVVDLPAPQQERAIEDHCGDDAELRLQIRKLLDADSRASRFIAQPAAASAAVLEDFAAPPPPEVVGPYRVIREIGRGGMGTVYLAEREGEFTRKVALKIIRTGMQTEYFLRRFRTERQILASLDHPNIARLLDGGTTGEGLPYFVMELVDGVPIDRYCAENNVSVADRLKLFVPICSAVQYAHQHLVVHRDIKPTNILVTADGVPKLLDFGVAKLLDAADAEMVTATELRVMTPEYASPEQITGGDVATTSDVYSLGVVLFELLTGQRPYRFTTRAPAEVARIITDTQPARPSTVVEAGDAARVRRLRGDLDNIILMALRKDPQRRYGSAEALARDLQRHLDGLPVSARPDTVGYRLGKLIRRNRLAVGAAAALLIALVGGVVATAHQARVARAERNRAERRFNDVWQLARTLVFDIESDIQELPGATPVREKLVSKAVSALDMLAKEADDPRLQTELALAYQKIGDIQGNPWASNLGQTANAVKSYQKSQAILEPLAARRSNDQQVLLALATAYAGVGDMAYQNDELKATEGWYRKAIATYERASRIRPLEIGDRRRSALVLSKYADVLGNPGYANLGRPEEALALHLRALRIREAIVADAPHDKLARRGLAEAWGRVSVLENSMGRYAAAAEHALRAKKINDELLAADPGNAQEQSNVAFYNMLASGPLRQLGRYSEAEVQLEGAVAAMRKLHQSDPSSAFYRRALSVLNNHLATVRLEMGDPQGAAAAAEESISAARALAAEQKSSDSMLDYFVALRRGVEASLALSQPQRAAEQSRLALSLIPSLKLAENQKARFEHAMILSRYGQAMIATGNRAEGLSLLQESATGLEKLTSASTTDVQMQDELARTALVLADALASSDHSAACARYVQSAGLWQRMHTAGKLASAAVDLANRARTAAAACAERPAQG